MNFKVIGFDLDGTLYPFTEEIKNKNSSQIHLDLSDILNLSIEEVRNLYNPLYKKYGSGSKSVEIIFNNFGLNIDSKTFIADSLSKTNVLDLIKRDLKLNTLLSKVREKTDYLDLISARESDYAYKIMGKLGLELNNFDEIVFSTKNLKKSDGSIYKDWINMRNITPEYHLYIGDNEKVDILSPKKLGIKTCKVGNFSKHSDFNVRFIHDIYKLFF